MRQTKFQLAEVLNFGLLRSNPDSVNQKGFLALMNIRPWETSLKYVTKMASISVNEPTQVFTTNVGVFAVNYSAVFKLVDGILVKQLDFATDNSYWSIADFAKFVILSNGTSVVFIDSTGTCSFDAPVGMGLIPNHTCMTHVGGQLIVGGLDASFNNLDSTYIAWSRINSVNFELSNDNESGFMCPNIGVIKNVLPFEKGFIAFGTTGIAKFLPHGVTFSYELIHDVGVIEKKHCAGNEKNIYFVDFHSQLVTIFPVKSINPEKGITVLDYSWLLADKDVSLFYLGQTNELWIRNSNGNYVLNKFGMYQVSIEVSGICFDGAKLITLNVSGSQEDAWFTTSKMDFNIGGDKTLSEVYIQDSADGTRGIEVIVTRNRTDYTSRLHLTNSEGITHPFLTGNVMRVVHSNSGFGSGSISNLHFQTIRVDGRSGLGYAGGNNQ